MMILVDMIYTDDMRKHPFQNPKGNRFRIMTRKKEMPCIVRVPPCIRFYKIKKRSD